MKTQTYIFFGFITILTACGVEKEVEIQAPLSIDKTAKIFADHIMADAATASAIPYTRDSLQTLYYNQIFEMHKVDISDYQSALEYYSKQDSGMHKIFDQIDSLLKIAK